MNALVEVRVADLVGQALDWAVAQVLLQAGELTADSEEHGTGRPYFTCKFARPSLWGEGREQKGTINQETGGPWVMHGPGGTYSPSTDWSQGGPLIQQYGVLLSPKESPIHINGGPNAGWREDGQWGATIFRKGEHRRKAHKHLDEPLVAAMRCIVGWASGETVSVRADLVQAVQS